MELKPIFENFIGVLLTGILSVLGVFLIALVKKGFNWLSAKIGLIQQEQVRQDLSDLNKLLEDTVCQVVTSLQQTLGDEIKQSIKDNDGKYTREDLLKLKSKALEQIMNQITDRDWGKLSEIYDNLIGHISDLIEVNVYQLKSNRSTEIIGIPSTTLLDGSYEVEDITSDE